MTNARRAALAGVAAAAAVLAALPAVAAPAARPQVTLTGVGPLKLGMAQTAAVATGWLAGRAPGCELAGPPRPVTYRLTGPKAPQGVGGVAEFTGGKLTSLSFTKGVRTGLGVVPGTTTVTEMLRVYRRAGFQATARFDATFQGTFVSVSRNGRQRLGGFAEKKVVTLIGLPVIAVCE